VVVVVAATVFAVNVGAGSSGSWRKGEEQSKNGEDGYGGKH